jgi:lycopene cyclase domain-containing protein
MWGEYTIGAVAVPIVVVAAELTVLRTGIFRQWRYWATIALVLAFQVPVDGLLTGGRTPIVSYRPAATSHVRAPGSIPIEDFGFGFALITLTLVLWQWNKRRTADDDV